MKGRRDRATTDVRVFVRGVLRVLRLLRAHRLQPRTLRGLMEILPLLVSNWVVHPARVQPLGRVEGGASIRMNDSFWSQ